ncbi:MAG: hypothetical protein BGO98_18335 [Myxococcales bacterium 68-20]|nr:MAG: hypothetical protein BGO98_18335 [Myxococcales bacterium 68-20]
MTFERFSRGAEQGFHHTHRRTLSGDSVFHLVSERSSGDSALIAGRPLDPASCFSTSIKTCHEHT